MHRQALIIECSRVPGQEPLPGAVLDAAAWRSYLSSENAGAWKDSEIVQLSNPRKADVLSKIAAMTEGYAFIAYSGHGDVLDDKGIKTTRICVYDGLMTEIELTPKSCSRSTIVLDSCRGVVTKSLESARASVLLDHLADRESYRNMFDNAVEKAEKGTCRIYGCDFEESASEDNRGGLFTSSLIGVGASWDTRGVLFLNRAFQAAQAAVRIRESAQNPTANFGRRMNHFPFAVKP